MEDGLNILWTNILNVSSNTSSTLADEASEHSNSADLNDCQPRIHTYTIEKSKVLTMAAMMT